MEVSLSDRFWAKAVYTAVYLIDPLSTFVHHHIQEELSSHQKLLYIIYGIWWGMYKRVFPKEEVYFEMLEFTSFGALTWCVGGCPPPKQILSWYLKMQFDQFPPEISFFTLDSFLDWFQAFIEWLKISSAHLWDVRISNWRNGLHGHVR